MPDTNSIAQQFTGLPIKALIGAPLMAAAEANGQMALEQVNFMLNSCFKGSDGASDKEAADKAGYEPIMIRLNLIQNVIDTKTMQNKPITSTIEVPLLALIPLNSLAVDNVNVNFNMEVKSSSSEDKNSSDETNSTATGKFSGGANYGIFSVHVSGSISASSSHKSSDDKHYEKSQTATYDISVHAGQLPLPPGVTTIIQAYANNISPIKISTGDSK
jgi:hypothetical protein